MRYACCIEHSIDKHDRLALVCSFNARLVHLDDVRRRLVEALECKHPRLAQHTCSNNQGSYLGACLYETPVFHLFEHLILEYLVQDALAEQSLEDAERYISAATHRRSLHIAWSTWRDKEAGRAYIEISYQNKERLVQAIKLALDEFNRAAREVDYDKRTYGI